MQRLVALTVPTTKVVKALLMSVPLEGADVPLFAIFRYVVGL